jgi:fatty acid desaturase
VFPSIPNYNLPEVHRLLVAAGIPVPTNRSYFGFLFQKIRAEWRSAPAARERA